MNILKSVINVIGDQFRPVLSDRTIKNYNSKGLLIETPLGPHQIQPNSVDLTLADTWKTLLPNRRLRDQDVIDTRRPIEYKKGMFAGESYWDSVDKDMYVLQPKQFVLMASREILNIPNGIVCFVQGRSSIARLAIQTEQAGLIDAGFRGTITFEVFNQDEYPIVLYPGMRIAQVYFFKAQRALVPYGEDKGSKYNSQIVATGSRIHMDAELQD